MPLNFTNLQVVLVEEFRHPVLDLIHRRTLDAALQQELWAVRTTEKHPVPLPVGVIEAVLDHPITHFANVLNDFFLRWALRSSDGDR